MMYITDHPYMILIIDGSGLSKNNILLNLIKHQQTEVDKVCLCVKDPFESKYQLLINGGEKKGIINVKTPKTFIDYSQTIDNIYENLEDRNRTKKKVLIVFDDMIPDMEANKKLKIIIAELFMRGRKLNISVISISQSYFAVSKTMNKCDTLFHHKNI